MATGYVSKVQAQSSFKICTCIHITKMCVKAVFAVYGLVPRPKDGLVHCKNVMVISTNTCFFSVAWMYVQYVMYVQYFSI